MLNEFQTASENEVDNIIKNLDKNKCKNEEVSTDIIIPVWNVNRGVIIDMINCSIEQCKIPALWKNSIIHPIQKVRGSRKAEDYRPINTLPILEKILEEIIKNQLEEHITKNKILKEEQSGFRTGHSCETALLKIISERKAGLDEGKLYGVLYLDLKRAFKTININRLIEKLERKCGVKQKAIEWLKSYLNNRTQQVRYGKGVSKKKKVKNGVPQSSKLGPLLFILCINGIIEIAKKYGCECKLFADDLILYVCDKSVDKVELILNRTLIDIENWLGKNSLKVNTKKTVFMLIHDRRIKVEKKCNIMIVRESIIEVNETKYLGIIIDKYLTFESHTYYISQKVNKKIGFLRRVGHQVGYVTRILIYKIIIAPHYEYCRTLMLNMNKHCMNMLQKTQNRAMRAILRVNRYTTIENMLDALCFMSMEQRAKYNVCVTVYKMINKITPDYLNREIANSSHKYNTRNGDNLVVTRKRTRSAEKSINYEGFNLYNKLPVVTKKADTIACFRRNLIKDIKKDKI